MVVDTDLDTAAAILASCSACGRFTPDHGASISMSARVFAPDCLAGRTAMITGVRSGIGFAIAQALAAAGAPVVLVSRKLDRLQDATQSLRSAEAEAIAVAADVREGEVVQAAVATMRALEGWPGCAHAAAKAGFISLIRSLAVEWGPDGTLCNTIAAGPIGGTEGVKRLYEETGHSIWMPLGRLGQKEDFAQAALYLCSDAKIL